jgi:hypothetical protein
MNLLRESLTVKWAMRRIDREYEELVTQQAVYDDPRSGSVARMFVLGRCGVEFGDIGSQELEDNMADLMELYGISPDSFQQVLQRHEPQLAADEEEQ